MVKIIANNTASENACKVKTGLEVLISSPPAELDGKKIGLLCNPASVSGSLIHARDLVHEAFAGQLCALFSPQHGFYAEKQDNMIESAHRNDPRLNLPVFSLYGDTRVPDSTMMGKIDVLLIDLQDVGTRVYTFIYTMSYCLEAAKKHGKRIYILDRPNPIGGLALEGNILAPEFSSFVGRYPIPMRHGLTMGEMALFFNRQFNIDADLKVIKMKGWERKMTFSDTGLPWVAPSPNMPTVDSAIVYPGQVLFEGTNISEGRGTTQPFELIGAPFLEPERIMENLNNESPPGTVLRYMEFEPTANKWVNQICRGFQIHITDHDVYRPYETGLSLLQVIYKLYPDKFLWKRPPYEYEFEKMPIDLIIGDRRLRKKLESGYPIHKMRTAWQKNLDDYKTRINSIKLYS